MTQQSVFTSKQVRPGTWLIASHGSAAYLLQGSESCLMIDTGDSTDNNIREYAQGLTDRPVTIVANTHDHFDHCGLNGLFDCAYMSAAAAKTAKFLYDHLKNRFFKADYPVRIIGDGFKFELGGREIEVFDIPAHSPTSVAFLDNRERIVFSGDEIAVDAILISKLDEPQPSIQQYEKNLLKLMARRNEFDYVCFGHGSDIMNGNLVERCLANARHILAGNEGEPYSTRRLLPAGTRKPEDGPFFTKLQYKRLSEFSGVMVGYDVRFTFDQYKDCR
jgi:glyoxylase-like metal-dependent hydrolase (beta-lactamase superfamily II)